ncbi:hypothetical protein L218DRAFT_960648 [Marasmius fiardii PR-910]|nr:hypothetical protein L218DRAFT_960648 [Marasmius fiardii PR-910]
MRSLTTEYEYEAPTLLRGSVNVHNVPTSSHLSTLLQLARVGPIERIRHESHSSRAFVDFIDPVAAGLFCQRLRVLRFVKDAEIGLTLTEEYTRPSASTVALIGFRSASRCIMIFALPEGITKDSLKVNLSRFGPVEKVDIFQRTVGRVHFFSVESAFLALLTLRKQLKACNTKLDRVHFTADRFDFAYINRKLEVKQNRPTPRPHSVVIGGLSKFITINSVINLVEEAIAPLHVNGEALRDLTSYKKKLFLNFMRSADTALFVDMFKAEIPAMHGGKGEATVQLVPPEPMTMHHLHFNRAVRMGATRKLFISDIQGWGRIDRQRIHEDFSKFGPITDISISESENCALITFRTLNHAMKAMTHIHADNQAFRRYAGTKITFFQHPESVIPPPLPIHIRCDEELEGQGDDVGETPVADAMASPVVPFLGSL